MVKSNKLFKILIMMLVVIFVMGAFGGVVNAQGTTTTTTTTTGTTGSSIGVDDFTKAITPTDPGADASTKIKSVAGNVLYILQAVGMVAGVAIVAYMGIKYITSSPDGKAEIKKQAFIYIGGAALLMLAPTVANLVFNAVK